MVERLAMNSRLVLPIAAIAIGWPAESPPPRTRYRDDAVHRETW